MVSSVCAVVVGKADVLSRHVPVLEKIIYPFKLLVSEHTDLALMSRRSECTSCGSDMRSSGILLMMFRSHALAGVRLAPSNVTQHES